MQWLDPAHIYATFFGANVIIAPEYLFCAVLIAYLLYRFRKTKGGFWAWLVPKRIYAHPSHMLDIKLFVLGRLLTLVGLFNKIAVTSVVAVLVSGWIAGDTPETSTQLNPWLIALAIFVLNDFIVYWVHRIYHENRWLWPLHSLHHSAEVLTPVTAYRQHPLSDIISGAAVSLGFGLAQGLFLGLLGAEFTGAQIAGVNSFFFILNVLMANFRHSHIWVSFGPFWERLIISPAQHQIHHSLEPRHHNKNYGENFAIWDWMFGSLYIPQEQEEFGVGLADAEGKALEQRHTGLGTALLVPLRDIAATARSSRPPE